MEIKLLVFVLLAIKFSLIMESACFSLIITQKLTVIKKRTIFTVMCEADVPLVECHVREYWRDPRYKFVGGTGTFFDKGVNNGMGRCGVYINATYDSFLTYRQYGCRARSYGGGWQYDHQVVRPKKYKEEDIDELTMPPQRIFSEPGTDVTLGFYSVKDYTKCYFKWPGVYLFQETADNYTNISIIRDNSRPLRQCSVTLHDLSGESSGFVTMWAETKELKMNFRILSLIVKTAPHPPVLTLNKPDGVYFNGDTLMASCHVSPGRPIAKITWLLGGTIIRNDLHNDDDIGAEWVWVYEPMCITQELELQVTMADNGRPLTCRAYHIGWAGGMVEASQTIMIGTDASESNLLLNLTWFSIGVAVSSLIVAMVLAFLICCTYATTTWCFMRKSCRTD